MTISIHAFFDDSGRATGFWDPRAYPAPETVLPSDTIMISEEQWRELLDYPDRRFVNGVVVEYEPPPPAATVADLGRERDRRLALGFDYDFGDARGVHHVGTTASDMRKWMDEVNPLAQALVNSGQAGGEISIVTDTGAVVITANEWQGILLAAAAYRQPIYAACFALKALDPIPADFADDAYWPA